MKRDFEKDFGLGIKGPGLRRVINNILTWILVLGYWNDVGIWIDEEQWIDG